MGGGYLTATLHGWMQNKPEQPGYPTARGGRMVSHVYQEHKICGSIPHRVTLISQ